eukprot:scaffold69307_cov45-Phaeocystis_antarctica.AAC.5
MAPSRRDQRQWAPPWAAARCRQPRPLRRAPAPSQGVPGRDQACSRHSAVCPRVVGGVKPQQRFELCGEAVAHRLWQAERRKLGCEEAPSSPRCHAALVHAIASPPPPPTNMHHAACWQPRRGCYRARFPRLSRLRRAGLRCAQHPQSCSGTRVGQAARSAQMTGFSLLKPHMRDGSLNASPACKSRRELMNERVGTGLRLGSEPTPGIAKRRATDGGTVPGGRGRRERDRPAPGAPALRLRRRHGLAASEVPRDRAERLLITDR